MWEYRPVMISEGSFAFCRYTVAILVWLGLLLQNKWAILAVTLIMLASAILKVQRAPLVWIYRATIDRIKPSSQLMVDEKGIRFAHIMGSIMGCLCTLLLFFAPPFIAWIAVGIFAILKTMAAFGLCSALKLYGCMANGTCCRVGKKIKGQA